MDSTYFNVNQQFKNVLDFVGPFCAFILGVLIVFNVTANIPTAFIVIRVPFVRHFVRLCPSALEVYRQLCRNEAEMAADLRLMEDYWVLSESGHNRKIPKASHIWLRCADI